MYLRCHLGPCGTDCKAVSRMHIYYINLRLFLKITCDLSSPHDTFVVFNAKGWTTTSSEAEKTAGWMKKKRNENAFD